MAATNINYHIDQQATHSTVTLLPGLNNAQWSDIEQAGTDIMGRLNGMRSPAVMVDLTPLTYMGSSMVAMIVRFWKGIQSNGGQIVVVCNNDVVREVISLAGLTKVWSIVQTREEGMKTLGVSASEGGGEGRWLIVLGIIAALMGGTGAGLLLSGSVIREISLGVLFGGAGVGFVVGLVTLVRSTTSGRNWGLGIVLASTAVAIIGFMSLGQPAAAPDAEPAAKSETAPESDTAAKLETAPKSETASKLGTPPTLELE